MTLKHPVEALANSSMITTKVVRSSTTLDPWRIIEVSVLFSALKTCSHTKSLCDLRGVCSSSICETLSTVTDSAHSCISILDNCIASTSIQSYDIDLESLTRGSRRILSGSEVVVPLDFSISLLIENIQANKSQR